MKGLSARKSKDLLEHILVDYHFLEDYEVLESQVSDKNNFVACIRNTQQKVRFRKLKYDDQVLPRFKALHQLYTNGIILADNLFILQECEQLYYYVIEAETAFDNSRFQTLQQYLYSNQLSIEESKAMLGKIKILIDCLHQEGQAYAGIDSRRIIIDDEQHLYLAPFDLEFQLRTDSYSRAYYPPEILSKISKGDAEINEEMMQKWDVWSFGCICLQILAYSSPVFLSTSLSKQVRTIEQFTFPQLESYETSVHNIVKNSLSLNVSCRTISTNVVSDQRSQRYQNYEPCAQTIENMTAFRNIEPINTIPLKELNILQQNQGDSMFTLQLLTLSNITFEKELHITVHLEKVYHFYIDYSEDSPSKYVLNRKLTVKGFFRQFQQWLSAPIQIQLKENDKNATIMVNVQTMVMIHNQQRVWSESISGVYSSSSSSDFSKARMKLKCSLLTPENVKLEGKIVSKDHDTSSKQIQEENKEEKKQEQSQMPLKQKKLNILPRKSTKSDSKIPTISQISQSLTLLTEQLRRKMAPEDQQQDPIQKQLSSLLELQ